jgi:hypothetical protein
VITLKSVLTAAILLVAGAVIRALFLPEEEDEGATDRQDWWTLDGDLVRGSDHGVRTAPEQE